MKFRTHTRFNRDLKRAARRGRDLGKLRRILGCLAGAEPLASRHRAHPLRGAWRGFMECHIEPDWLLIWREEPGVIVLVRTGSHADLFG